MKDIWSSLDPLLKHSDKIFDNGWHWWLLLIVILLVLSIMMKGCTSNLTPLPTIIENITNITIENASMRNMST